MINENIYIVRQDQKLYNYLKYHSYWYDLLTFNSDYLKQMNKEMKIETKDTVEDKIIDFTKKLELLSSLLEVLS